VEQYYVLNALLWLLRSSEEFNVLKSVDGKVLVSSPINDGLDLSDHDLRRADFHQVTADGLNCAGADLREADFSDCDLYWLDMYTADCTGASFRRSKLEGVNFKSACLQRADFSYAIITHDNLGGPSTFAHSNLDGASFEGASLVGTEYDEGTIFPAGFDPISYGMVLVRRADDSLVEPPCKN
jgi:uncharacterized protein YjbI with pentapeptide repeats